MKKHSNKAKRTKGNGSVNMARDLRRLANHMFKVGAKLDTFGRPAEWRKVGLGILSAAWGVIGSADAIQKAQYANGVCMGRKGL